MRMPSRGGGGTDAAAQQQQEQVREARGPSDKQRQYSGRQRIESAGVPDARLVQRAPRHRDDVVRGDAGRLVNDEPAVRTIRIGGPSRHTTGGASVSTPAPGAMAGAIAASSDARAVR